MHYNSDQLYLLGSKVEIPTQKQGFKNSLILSFHLSRFGNTIKNIRAFPLETFSSKIYIIQLIASGVFLIVMRDLLSGIRNYAFERQK